MVGAQFTPFGHFPLIFSPEALKKRVDGALEDMG